MHATGHFRIHIGDPEDCRDIWRSGIRCKSLLLTATDIEDLSPKNIWRRSSSTKSVSRLCGGKLRLAVKSCLSAYATMRYDGFSQYIGLS